MKESKSSKLALLASLIAFRAPETDQMPYNSTTVNVSVRKRISQGALLMAAFALLAVAGINRSFAGTFNADFSSGNLPAAGVTLNGYAYITNNATGIHLTDTGVGGSQGTLALDDLDAGASITGFTMDFDILLGNGAAGNADGLSISFGADVSSSSSFGEEGANGDKDLVVEFDTYDNGGADNIGIDIKQSGVEIAVGRQYNLAYIYKSSFVHCTVIANNDTSLTLVYDNQIVYSNLFGAFLPTQGQFALGARTGGANEDCFIKNLKITTINTLPPHPYLTSTSPAANASGVSPAPTLTLTLSDTATQVDPASIVLSFNGVKVSPTVTKAAPLTTITFTPSGLLPSGSTNTVSFSYADNGTPVYSNKVTYTFLTAVYGTLTPDFALSAADAAKAKTHPGFLVQLVGLDAPSQFMPNSNDSSESLLFGETGPNVGDLSTYTDNGQLIPNLFDEPVTINYPSGSVPGVPTLAAGYATAATDNFAMGFFTAIEFPTAGLYTFVVNSDDGFRTYMGTNLIDRFQQGNVILGEFNGGRGTADSPYTFNVTAPGIYPFRTTYEEGGGGYAVHWFPRNADGTPGEFNDATGLKAYQFISQTRAYIRSITPGPTPFGLAYYSNSPTSLTIVVGDGSLTKYVAGSAKLQWDGQDVTASLVTSTAGGLTTITYTPPTPLFSSADHAVTLSYDESSTPVSTRTASWTSVLGPPRMKDLAASSFWIEAEDFDSKGTSPAATSVMPYLGGALSGMPATWGVDYNNNDVFDTAALYRDEATADLGTSGKSVDITPQLPNEWGTDRPGGAQLTENYRIGWADNGEWYNYTRTVPAGIYKAYALLSYGDYSANNMGGKISIVTSGVGTPNQTVVDVGQFDSDGSGAWGNSSLVPMHSLAPGPRAPGYVKLPGGSTTLRFTVRVGDYDGFILSPTTGVPAALSSASGGLPSIRRDSALVFTMNDYSTAVATNSIKLLVDGADATSSSSITKAGDITTVSYKAPGMFVAGAHNYSFTFGDNGSPPKSTTVTNVFHVNPYPTPGTFLIEAEDFDYNGGKFNPRTGVAGFDVNVMPYYGGAYSNLDATLSIDYNNDDANDSQVYRTNLIAHTGSNVDITDNLGGTWGADRGTWTMTNNYRIGWIGTPDWCDYTRTFPAGGYQVWAALSHGDALGTAHDLRGSLDLVTAGAGTTNQTLQPLGVFDGPSSGAWGNNELVPLSDANGVWQTVQLSGTQTVRFNADSGDFDYFILVPAGPVVTGPHIDSVAISSGNIVINWSGGGTLQSSPELKTWTDTQYTTGTASIPIAGNTQQFYRVKK